MRTMWAARSMPGLRWLAFACGLGPLAIGVFIFALWLITRDATLPLIGFGLIFPLLAFIGVGLVAWASYGVAGLVDRDARPKEFWDTLASSGCILLVNFPVAICMIFEAMFYSFSYRVEVRNDSGTPVHGVVIRGPGDSYDFGTVAPGQRAQCALSLNYEGPISLTVHDESGTRDTPIEGYVGNVPHLNRKIVTFHPDGSASVADRDGPLIRRFWRESNGAPASNGD